jgi:hypothetical protein
MVGNVRTVLFIQGVDLASPEARSVTFIEASAAGLVFPHKLPNSF